MSSAGSTADVHAARRRPTPAPPVRGRFTELDGLRGVAAFGVVAFHLRHEFEKLGTPTIPMEIIGGQYLMVDLFFVLSGFVLAKKMLSTDSWDDVRAFSMMRIRRFAPLHVAGWASALFFLTLTLIWQLAGDPDAPGRMAFTKGDETPWAWFSSLFLLHGYLGPEFAGYSAAWSLSIELWSNIAIVVGIALVPWRRFKYLVGLVAVLVGAAMLMTNAKGDPNTLGLIGAGRGLFGLGLGMLVYQAYLLTLHRRQAEHGEEGSARSRTVAGVVAVAGLVALVATTYWSHLVQGVGDFMPAGLVSAVAVIALATPSGGWGHRLLNSRVAQWLGTRSFALYALHGSVLIGLEWIIRFGGWSRRSDLVNVALIVSTYVGALIAAEIGHRWIERSWEQAHKRRSRRPGTGPRHNAASTPAGGIGVLGDGAGSTPPPDTLAAGAQGPVSWAPQGPPPVQDPPRDGGQPPSTGEFDIRSQEEIRR